MLFQNKKYIKDMKIKKFGELNEGITQHLKPKSIDKITEPLKETLLSDCDSVIEYINNIKQKYQDGEIKELDKFLEDVVKLEVLNQIRSNRKHDQYDYDINYHRRLAYLKYNLGLKDLDDER